MAENLTEAQIENAKLAPGESRVSRKRIYKKRSVLFVLAGAMMLSVSAYSGYPILSGEYQTTTGSVSSVEQTGYRTDGGFASPRCTSTVTFTVNGYSYTAKDNSEAPLSCHTAVGSNVDVRYNAKDIAGTATAVPDSTSHLWAWGMLAAGITSIVGGVLAWRSGEPIIVRRRMDGTITTEKE